MKKIFVAIIALAISLSVNAQSYDKLWKEYNENMENYLPESAGKVLDKIEKKALNDKNEVQILKMMAERSKIFAFTAENPNDTIIGYCKAYLPKLSKASQVLVNIELAKHTIDFKPVLEFIHDDFIKNISMKDYAILFENEESDYDLELEPTLYDFVLHSLINNYCPYEDKVKLYQYLLDFDLENGYIKAYYNNRINRLGYTILNKEGFIEFEQLAKECPVDELIAKIRVHQIIYLSTADWGQEPDYVLAKQYCEEVMRLVDADHQYYSYAVETLQHINQKTIRIMMQNAYVPNTYIPVALTYRNTTNPSYKIFKVSAKEFEWLLNLYDKNFLKALFANEILVENTISLPEETDYNEHSTLISLPPLEKGFYYTVFSTTDKFDNLDDLVFMGFQVTNLSYFYSESENVVTMHIVDRETGLPKKGVTASFARQVYDFQAHKNILENVGSAVSDKNGLIVSQLDLDYNTYVELYHDGDTMLSIKADRVYSEKSDEEPVIKTNFYTDRAIYRPGQTVQFKGIVYQQTGNKQELLTDFETTVCMYSNYHLFDSLNIISDEFGSISGSFNIPNDVLNGRFCITNDYGSLNFVVEEYKRPTFEVTFNTPEQEYKIGDSVTVTGKVMALSGFGLDNVKYSYTVYRKYQFPWGLRDIMEPISDIMIASGEGKTDNEGCFTIDFQLLPNEKIKKYERPFYTYLIEVKATNAQGESQSETFTVVAAYNKYNINLTNNEASIDISDLKNIEVTVTNIGGKPASTNIEYKIFKFNDLERFKKHLEDFDRQILSDEQLAEYFPNFDYYADKHISKELLYQGVICVDGNAKLLPQDLKLDPSQYLIELQSVDDTLSIISKEYLVYDLKSNKLPCKSMCWTLIDKTTAHKGETVNFYVGSSLENASAIILLSSGDKILKMKRVKLNNNVYKFSYKINDLDLGYVYFTVRIVKHNCEMSCSKRVEIPFDNRKLNITLNTERNKMLPGETETWSVTIKDYKNKPVIASLMAGMYDASLDKFIANRWYATNSWNFNNIPVNYHRSGIHYADYTFMTKSDSSKESYLSSYFYWDYFNNKTYSDNSILPYLERRAGASLDAALCVVDNEEVEYTKQSLFRKDESNHASEEKTDVPAAKIRKDFNETAFFYPNLRTDKNGNVTFTFTMPDALTRWKLRMLAYDKDLKVGSFEKEFVTQKPLMIMADMPRFVYDEDTLWIAANLINLSDEALAPSAKLEVFDDADHFVDLIISEPNIIMEPIPAGQSRSVRWKVAMKKDLNVLKFRFSAITDGFSDAEQHEMPVLSTDIFMTQTYALTAKAHSVKEYNFDINRNGERNHKITLHFNENPLWTAIHAMPYIAEGDEKYALTAFYRYFVNKMSLQIMESHPEIAEKIENTYKNDTLSELQKHEDLKAILLQETPWVLEAANEAKQRASIVKLFDSESVRKNIESARDVLAEKQTVNGGWPWMDGMPESGYITQYIISGLARLGLDDQMTENAFHFIENQIVERYLKLDTQKKKNDAICDFMTMKGLYTMSFFNYETNDKFNEAKSFFIKKLFNDWKLYGVEEQSHIALILNRNNHNNVADLIVKSLRERAIKNELGMYWRNCDLMTEVRILEAFNEIDPKTEEIDAMRLWILTQKRTNMWENERASAEAISALVNTGSDWTENGDVTLTINGEIVKSNDTTLYEPNVKTRFITSLPVKIDNNSDHVAWGGLYRQYFVPIDKVQKHNDAMKITRELIMSENVKVGDKVTVKITFENNQDMDFVYLKDLRGACFEPTEQLSRYHWNNGLWYYQSTSDVSMEFFFERLPKGKHTVSYDVYVTKEGSFSAGYSFIQCQYAPEFGAYSNGARIYIE